MPHESYMDAISDAHMPLWRADATHSSGHDPLQSRCVGNTLQFGQPATPTSLNAIGLIPTLVQAAYQHQAVFRRTNPTPERCDFRRLQALLAEMDTLRCVARIHTVGQPFELTTSFPDAESPLCAATL